MYIYKVKQNTFYKDYSKEYKNIKEALKWYKNNGIFLEKLSNRKLVLFNKSKKVK
jgi:hypothetical protein